MKGVYFPLNNIYCFYWNTAELLGCYLGIRIMPMKIAPWLFGKCIGRKPCKMNRCNLGESYEPDNI